MSNIYINILPWDSIEDARKSIGNLLNRDIKIKNDNNLNVSEGHALEAMVICKFFKTIEKNKVEFLKMFQTEYISKVFWDDTTWNISYSSSSYKYSIKSGTTMGYYREEYTTRKNEVIDVSYTIERQLVSLLTQMRSQWPSNRFKELLERIETYSKFTKYS